MTNVSIFCVGPFRPWILEKKQVAMEFLPWTTRPPANGGRVPILNDTLITVGVVRGCRQRVVPRFQPGAG